MIKKVLFIVGKFPFPPKDGVDLPLSKLVSYFKKKNIIVDLCVIGECKGNVEPLDIFGDIFYLNCYRENKITANIREILGIKPSYFYKCNNISERYSMVGMSVDYDIVWFSPIGTASVIESIKKYFGDRKSFYVLGLNDVKSAMYMDSVKELFSGRFGFDLFRISRMFRLFQSKILEKKTLVQFDAIHVQTKNELQKLNKLIDQNFSSISKFYAQNGVKQEFLDLKYIVRNQLKDIVVMTHMDTHRRKEMQWFLKYVWTSIHMEFPNIKLHILGAKNDYEDIQSGINYYNYVDDLGTFLLSMDLMVIPTLHSTGINNRLLDALSIGMPIICTPQAAQTVDGLNEANACLLAYTKEEYVKSFDLLASNLEERIHMATASKSFANTLPTWDQTSEKILKILNKEIHENI